MEKPEEIKRIIEERNNFIKQMIATKQTERLSEFFQLAAECAKTSCISEAAQKRLESIQKRACKSGKKLPVLPVSQGPVAIFEKLQKYDDLEKQLKLMKYIKRVNETAANKLLDDADFAEKFFTTEEFNAVILSVDIRRSTELMLKCRSSKIFAEFITLVASEFEKAVKNHYGVYDKFTGDGFLAFFPDFYSGKEALMQAVLCAADCKDIFQAIFDEYKDYFEIGNMETGIGAGIDTGLVYAEGGEVEYSVVGKPVVYACRFSSAPAGHIYLTKNASCQFEPVNNGRIKITETMVPVKHEKDMQAFDIQIESIPSDSVSAKVPDWVLE